MIFKKIMASFCIATIMTLSVVGIHANDVTFPTVDTADHTEENSSVCLSLPHDEAELMASYARYCDVCGKRMTLCCSEIYARENYPGICNSNTHPSSCINFQRWCWNAYVCTTCKTFEVGTASDDMHVESYWHQDCNCVDKSYCRDNTYCTITQKLSTYLNAWQASSKNNGEEIHTNTTLSTYDHAVLAGDYCEVHGEFACDIIIDENEENTENAFSQTSMGSNVENNISSIAYANLSNVKDSALKAEILEARSEIIFSTSWVADGITGYIIDPDGNKTEVPQFSEVFPADWDIPMMSRPIETSHNTLETNDELVVMAAPFIDVWTYYNDPLYLDIPSSLYDTDPFCTFSTSDSIEHVYDYIVTDVFTRGYYYYPSRIGTFNVGYSNETTGASLGYVTNLDNGLAFSIQPPAGITLGVRASTYDTVATWDFEVTARVEVYDN